MLFLMQKSLFYTYKYRFSDNLSKSIDLKNLFLIRHAKSSWKDPDQSDINRPLNNRGLKDAPFMANMLFEKENHVDLIVSSPAKRAFTTARFFANAFDYPIEKIEQEVKIYHAFPADILDIIREFPTTAYKVFIFGHNPTFTMLANMFAPSPIANVPTCGIIKIEANISSWKNFNTYSSVLSAFYFPKQFKE